MAITRHDPFRDMLQLQDQLFRTFEGAYGQRHMGEESRELATWSPPVDVFEDNDAITLKVELPEIDPEDEHFSAKMTVLSELVEHHADEEEDVMFTLAAKLGAGELDTLGMRMAARAEELAASLQESGSRSVRG